MIFTVRGDYTGSFVDPSNPCIVHSIGMHATEAQWVSVEHTACRVCVKLEAETLYGAVMHNCTHTAAISERQYKRIYDTMFDPQNCRVNRIDYADGRVKMWIAMVIEEPK